MPSTMVSSHQPHQDDDEEEETSSSKHSARNNGNGVTNSAAAAAAVIAEEQCTGAAISMKETDNEDNDPSLQTHPLLDNEEEEIGETKTVNKSSSPAIHSVEEVVNAPTGGETAEEAALIIRAKNESTVLQQQHQQQQHVETIKNSSNNVNNSNMETKDSTTQTFIQYQQQEQSLSSDSLVHLGQSLKQPLLMDDHPNDDDKEEKKTDKEENEQPGRNVDTTITGSSAFILQSEKSKTIDPDSDDDVGSQRMMNTSSEEEEENAPTTPNQTTRPFLSPNRATMSMSPSLLMNHKKEELSPPSSSSPPPHLHQQFQSPSRHHHYQHQGGNNNTNTPSRITYAAPPGRRSIKLRLLEEIPSSLPSPLSKTPFKSFRQMGRIRSLSLTGSLMTTRATTTTTDLDEKKSTTTTTTTENSDGNSANNMVVMDRGTITVSWYDGTTSAEMQEHVFGCVLRRLNQSSSRGGGGGGKFKLEDVRLLDENVEPHEEVVLCPFLPDGSQFMLRFRTVEDKPDRAVGNNPTTAFGKYHPFASRPPDSPSAEPSPHPSNANLVSLGGIHPQQLHLLNAAAAALLRPPPLTLNSAAAAAAAAAAVASSSSPQGAKNRSTPPPMLPKDFPDTNESNGTTVVNETDSTSAEVRTDDLIEQQLRQLNELFLQRRSGGAQDAKSSTERSDDLAEEEQYHREEKKQVIFLIGNYLVLFMSLIALSAEIQSRLPQMMKWVQENYDSVQNCATDRDALVDCLSKGDFSGLVASFLLWATQSVAAKRIFLFGFDTPKKLWTVVYEALVSAVCWGISYLFIRRGLNPNTRQNFVHKYWKDAVYGSLAGFNAAFLKAVLKNLVPQDVALEALEGRQLKIFHWLGTLLADE